MAPEDFPAAGICGGNWWSSSKSVFMGGGSSPCSMGINGDLGAYMSYWMGDMVDLKPRSSCKDYSYNNNIIYSDNIIDQASPGSGDHNSMVFQTSQKPQQADSDSGGSSILMDSTLQMMGFNISSSSSSSSPDWNEAFLHGNTASGRPEAYNSMLQEDMNLGLNASSEIQKDWASGNTKSFPSSNTTTATGGQDDPSIGPFKSINQDFSLDQQRLDNNPTATCQGLSSSGLPMGPAIYGYPSALIQSLFELDPPQPQQQSLFSSRSPMNYCGTDSLSERPSPSCWHKISSPSVLPKQQKANTDLHFSNSAPFWNASASSIDDIRSSFLSSSQPQFILPTLEEKPNSNNLTTKINNNIEEVRNSGSVVKKVCEPIFKRQRIEAPSPLPTFKVRKEKLGDRITALQQLVSPFGKTDTASVLHEATEYIKFLHDQVNVLSTPYMKNGNPVQRQQQTEDRSKDPEGLKQDLKSRGLCLVPISSTFPVASETTSDFWTPAFGGTFRYKGQ